MQPGACEHENPLEFLTVLIQGLPPMCGAADVVKTKFRVEPGGGPHPDDVWYAWLDDIWIKVPPEFITGFVPDEQAHLFVLARTIQCFVRPKGGL
jgi:hypothetical protein